MELSQQQQGPTAAAGSSSSVASLHTARKRSKASLASLGVGARSDSQSCLSGAFSTDPNSSSNSSSTTVIFDSSTGRFHAPRALQQQQQQHATVSIRTQRAHAPGRGTKGSGWVVAGYSLDYALDWTLVVVLGVVLAASEAGVPREVYMRKADLGDTAYPLLPNSVPSWSVPLYTLVLPAVLVSLHSVMLRRPLLEAHHLVLGVWTAVLFTAALTNIIKCPVGRLRPDFNARCWPDGKVAWAKEDDLGGYPLCSGPAGSVAEGRKSFPSGHSSWSASGLCFISWWLLDRLRVFDGSGHPWRLLAAAMPAMAAVAVGISRYVDYWHHASDVAAGLFLGAVVSWVCYRQHRGRLADIDPATYSSSGGGGGGSNGSTAGGWQQGVLGDVSRREGDGTPLLYHAPQHHFDLQQPQPGAATSLPV